ncbi:hypothetical protein AX14_003047 [Amanita brunnescens Koide BX004]|nr:hypothetical protein AX14_003047 [Amanita brunnescens Koide BX004]
MSSGRISESILKQYYPHVENLDSYLTFILCLVSDPAAGLLGHAFRPHGQDSLAYTSLVNTTLVATRNRENYQGAYKAYDPPVEMDMLHVIDKAQEKLLRARVVGHIITSGYRLSSGEGDKGKQGMVRLGITNEHVNTNVTSLQTPEWDALLQRIGVDAMVHLLADTSIFASLPNDCYCQMSGKAIIYLKPFPINPIIEKSAAKKRPLESEPVPYEQQAKRVKLSGNNQTVERHVADVVFTRRKLFYSRPIYVNEPRRLVVGLPPRHFLNQIRPSFTRHARAEPSSNDNLYSRAQAEHARLAAKYIFSRQYGLSNPFNAQTQSKKSNIYRDSLDKEDEIKRKGPCGTPKRIKYLVPTLDQMIWKHRKCGYKPLLNIACPSKTNVKKLDSSVILEMLSDHSSVLSQPMSSGHFSMVSKDASMVSAALSEAKRYAKIKPRFAEFVCEYHEVYRYVALVTKSIIPNSFWGSIYNLRLVLRHVKQFISCRKHESLSLHNVIQGFRTSDCDWLAPPGKRSQQYRVCVSDAKKRRELLEDFLFWYFDGFVSPLLKTTFYITDSSAYRNRLLYFRHDDWNILCTPLIERLTTETFEKLEENEVAEILKMRKLGFSFVRLLPKETGVRPIVNLSRRKPLFRLKGRVHAPLRGDNAGQSINQVLQAALEILKFEKERNTSLLGVSLFRPDGLYARLKAFKARLPRDADGRLPKLYFVKVDVQACFDTIEQRELLRIIDKLISEDLYMIQRYGQVGMTAGRPRRTFVKRATDEDPPHFLQYAVELAQSLRSIIFADEVVYHDAPREEILQLLRDHITENIVKIGNNFYRQAVGIPQGSILSSLLCSFYYGDMEKQFEPWTDPMSALFRLIDDYLYITTSSVKAKSFLDMMKKGHPKYGCSISHDKTLTNFDHGHQIMNVTEPNQTKFPWCGLLIDTKELTITVDYPRYFGINLLDSVTVHRGRSPGQSFVNRILLSSKSRSHIIYTDTNLNSEHVVHLNIYQNFLLLAMKVHTYLRARGLGSRKNESFIFRTVQNVINHTFSSVKSKSLKKLAVDNDGVCNVKRKIVVWLGNRAFYNILSQKAQHYPKILSLLRFELSRPRYRQYNGRFRSLVKEGDAGLAGIRF